MELNVKNQLISRTAKIILFINGKKDICIADISRALKIDYNFTNVTIRNLYDIGLVSIQEKNKMKLVSLTKLGKSVYKNYKTVEKTLR